MINLLRNWLVKIFRSNKSKGREITQRELSKLEHRDEKIRPAQKIEKSKFQLAREKDISNFHFYGFRRSLKLRSKDYWAEKIGCSSQTIAGWIKGTKPNKKYRKALCNYFGVEEYQLYLIKYTE